MNRWKYLYWFLLVTFVLSLLKLPFAGDLTGWSVVFAVINGIFLVPVYGFAYKIAIGNRTIARILFVIASLIFIPAIAVSSYLSIVNFSLIQWLLTMLGIGLMIFVFYPIYAYAFQSDEDIWNIPNSE